MGWIRQILDWIALHHVQITTLTFWALLLGFGQQYAAATGISLEAIEIVMRELLQVAFWGPLLLVILYGLRPLTLIPSALLTILAGSVFGVFPGILYALLGGVVSSFIPYGLGYFSSRKTRPNQAKSQFNLLFRTLEKVHEHPFQAVFISRLLYPPYDLVNFLFGSLRIPFLLFVAGTFTGNIIGAFGYVGIGASFEGVITSGSLEMNASLLALSFFVLLAGLVVMLVLRTWTVDKDIQIDNDTDVNH
jgi:uncharacterized membrane protein YdjX (TVP38/TMEM64 family)